MIPIPLNDNIRRRTFWVGTLALIVLNTLVFLYELSLGRELNRFVYLFGVIPARYTTPHGWMIPSLAGLIVPISVSVFCERLCGGLAAHRSQRRFTPSFHRRKRGDCWRAGRLLRLLPARLYHHDHLPDFLLLDRPSARRAGAGLLVPDPVSDGLSGAGHRIRHKRRRGLVGARGRLCHRCDSGARSPPIPQTNGNPLENALMGTTSNLSSICMD